MLQELVRAYAQKLGVNEDNAGDIAESDGIYTFVIERENLCTISESRRNSANRNNIVLMTPLGGNYSEPELLDALDYYGEKLRATPMYQEGFLVVTDDLGLGLCCYLDAGKTDAEVFCQKMDLYVTVVRYLVRPESEEDAAYAGGARDEAAQEIFAERFVPVPDTAYQKLLAASGIDAGALSAQYGILHCAEDFATHLYYHPLSGRLILDNALECDEVKVMLDLLYVNGLGDYDGTFECIAGAVHMISFADPREATPETLQRMLLKHRYVTGAAQNYIDDEGKHVKGFDLKELINAIWV